MPELPEVEVLVRHLAPLLQNRTIREVHVHRPKVLLPTSPRELQERLSGARFLGLTRRGKYLLFALRGKGRNNDFSLVGHLGMTGRMYLQPAKQSLPKHAAVVLRLGRENFIYEDQRYFGRLTLAVEAVAALGPEPFEAEFTPTALAQALQRSTRPVKVKLLDQELVAGVGNIYASEALFRAGISPRRPAHRVKLHEVKALHRAIRAVLREAIRNGSTIPLNFGTEGKRDGLFYYGQALGMPDFYEERLRVYDRLGQPCDRCGTPIRRLVQAARSTFYCPDCQR